MIGSLLIRTVNCLLVSEANDWKSDITDSQLFLSQTKISIVICV